MLMRSELDDATMVMLSNTSLATDTSSPTASLMSTEAPPAVGMVAAQQLVYNQSSVQKYLDFYDGMYVHPFYYQYLESLHNMADYEFYIVGLYIATVCSMGAMGNILVMYIFCT